MYEDDTTYTLLTKYNLLVCSKIVFNETFELQSMIELDNNVEGYGLQNVTSKGGDYNDISGGCTGVIAFADVDESRKQSGLMILMDVIMDIGLILLVMNY